LKSRKIWYIFLKKNNKIGIGEIAPLKGLSIDKIDNIENILKKICNEPQKYISNNNLLESYPAINFGIEQAKLDLKNGGGQKYFSKTNKDFIKINGLIWMGDFNFQKQQIDEKIQQKYKCIKVKIGNLDFSSDIEILKYIRQQDPQYKIQLRLDANGVFDNDDAFDKIKQLSIFKIHSIEQPIQAGQIHELKKLCKTSPIPIALDEELINIKNNKEKIELLTTVKPAYIVLKPTMLGGFKNCLSWIKIAKKHNIKYWITSSLESSICHNAIAQFCAYYINDDNYQGLGAGELFENNLPSHMWQKSSKLYIKISKQWNDIYKLIGKYLSHKNKLTFKTSGTTDTPKKIKFNKRQIKNSIKLTQKTFNLTKNQNIGLCLSLDYVAGIMQLLRVIELNMNLIVFDVCADPLIKNNKTIDFIAMSPKQLETTLKNQRDKKIKTIICGGAEIYNNPITTINDNRTKTKIYQTYGMTETLTHIAIKKINDKYYKILDGISFKQNKKNNCLIINAPHISKTPIKTCDIVKIIDDKNFEFIGRLDNILNIDGKKISAETLENKIKNKIKNNKFFIYQQQEKLCLVIENKHNLLQKISEKSTKIGNGALAFPVLSFKKYKIKKINYIDRFCYTKNGKINRFKTIEGL